VFERGTGLRSVVLGSVIFGASLTTKHIFSIFLAWLPFLTSVRSLSLRLAYGALALALFAGSFIPWLSDQSSAQGIAANVFRYTSTEGHSLTALISTWLPDIAQRTLFVLLLASCGVLFLRFQSAQRVSPFIYVTLLTALSSGMARNYLAIPLIALVIFSPCITAWMYFGVATLALVTVNSALGVPEVSMQLTTWNFVTYELLQLVLVAFLFEALAKRRYEKRRPPSASKTRASI